MLKGKWLTITTREQSILLDVLSTVRKVRGINDAEIDALIAKLAHASPHPNITIGVQGGLVQWTRGNPFPIRICDYDVEGDELVDCDERGQGCRIWMEPADASLESA